MLSQYTITIPQCFHGQMYQKIAADSSPIPASSDKTHLMNGLVLPHASPPAGLQVQHSNSKQNKETRRRRRTSSVPQKCVIIIKKRIKPSGFIGEKTVLKVRCSLVKEGYVLESMTHIPTFEDYFISERTGFMLQEPLVSTYEDGYRSKRQQPKRRQIQNGDNQTDDKSKMATSKTATNPKRLQTKNGDTPKRQYAKKAHPTVQIFCAPIN